MVEGDDLPPPITSFKSMEFHKGIIDGLRDKGITKPSPIQIQGLPAV